VCLIPDTVRHVRYFQTVRQIVMLLMRLFKGLLLGFSRSLKMMGWS